MDKDFATQRENLVEECADLIGGGDPLVGKDGRVVAREHAELLIDAAIRLGRLDGMEAAAHTVPVPALGPDDITSVCKCGGRVLHLDDQWCCLDCGLHGGIASS